jgi:hypothetical protein
MIQHGINNRATAATGVHDESSRSHALLRIYIRREEEYPSSLIPLTVGKGRSTITLPSTLPGLYKPGLGYNEGVLTLVDLAGSEHRIDSM